MLNKSKNQQPEWRRQRRQARCLSCSEPSHRGSEQGSMPCLADDAVIFADARSVGVPCFSRWRPPQPELNCSPRGSVRCRPHCSRDAGKRRVRCKRAGELVDDGVGRPDSGDVLEWCDLVFFFQVIVKHIITLHRRRKHFSPHVCRISSAAGG